MQVERRRCHSLLLAGCGALLVAAAVAACGDNGSSSSTGSVADASLERLERAGNCFSALGVQHAYDRADIAFFARDFKRGNTNNPAAAGNGIIEVAEYEPIPTATSSKPRPRYLVWVGRAVEESDSDPLANIGHPGSWVMYERYPDDFVIAGSRRCLHDVGSATDVP